MRIVELDKDFKNIMEMNEPLWYENPVTKEQEELSKGAVKAIEGVPWTLRRTIITVLCSQENGQSPEKQVDCFLLAERFSPLYKPEEEIEVSNSEITLIEDSAKKMTKLPTMVRGPLVAGLNLAKVSKDSREEVNAEENSNGGKSE